MHCLDDVFDMLAFYGHVEQVIFATMVIAATLLVAYFIFD